MFRRRNDSSLTPTTCRFIGLAVYFDNAGVRTRCHNKHSGHRRDPSTPTWFTTRASAATGKSVSPCLARLSYCLNLTIPPCLPADKINKYVSDLPEEIQAPPPRVARNKHDAGGTAARLLMLADRLLP